MHVVEFNNVRAGIFKAHPKVCLCGLALKLNLSATFFLARPSMLSCRWLQTTHFDLCKRPGSQSHREHIVSGVPEVLAVSPDSALLIANYFAQQHKLFITKQLLDTHKATSKASTKQVRLSKIEELRNATSAMYPASCSKACIAHLLPQSSL